MLLVSPSGAEVIDERLPYFTLPDWVDDPFAVPPPGDSQAAVLLADRYRVDGAIRFSNSGGVYYGVDVETREDVVIKEARPHTHGWIDGSDSGDAISALKHEWKILGLLSGVECVPQPFDLVYTEGHAFLIESRFDGISLRNYWARNDIIVSPWVRDAKRVARWAPRFRNVARQLVQIIDEIHTVGVIIGDLSSDNLLINAETGHMMLVDFESAVTAADSPGMAKRSALWGTQGFISSARLSRDRPLPEDDYYGAGMALYNSIAPVGFFALSPRSVMPMLDKFVRLASAPRAGSYQRTAERRGR